jgi:iron complex outermembrane receptor protein
MRRFVRPTNPGDLVSASIAAVVSMACAGQAFAQEPTELTEIVVTGIRGSLQKALDAKREAGQIVDGISAEDIGKFPDENVADSLQRVTGIQIDRAGGAGEATQIFIRGLNGDTSRTFVNGRSALSTGFGERAVDFRDYPAEVVSFVGVVKSPSASDIEGALSGHVDIVTAKPFDSAGGFRAVASARAAYSDLDQKVLPDVAASISNTFGDVWGASLSATYAQRDTRADAFQTNSFVCVNRTALQTVLNAAQCAAAGNSAIHRPRASRFQQTYFESTRWGLNGTLQFRPNDQLEVVVDAMYSAREDIADRIGIQVDGAPANGTLLAGSEVISPTNTLVAFNLAGGASAASATPQLASDRLFNSPDADTLIGGVNIKYTTGNWELAADVGVSDASGTGRFDGATMQQRGLSGLGIDIRGSSFNQQFGSFTSNPTGTAGWQATLVRKAISRIVQNDRQAKFDVAYKLSDEAFLDRVRFGARYSDALFESKVIGMRARSNFFAFNATPITDTSAIITSRAVTGVDNFGASLGGSQVANWSVPNIQRFWDLYLPSNYQELPNAPDFAEIDEITSAAYVQFDFGSADERLSGNVGVRYAKTKINSRAEAFAPNPAVPAAQRDAVVGTGFIFTPLALTKEYNNALPSLNVKYSITDDLVARFGASKTIFRAEADELSPRGTLDPLNSTITSGNTFLDPFKANRLDGSLEYYLGDGGLIAGAIFAMDIDSFISVGNTGQTVTVPGFPQTFAVVGPRNGTGGKVNGLELAFQKSFTNLPAPWDGLGVVANLTLIDDKTENVNALLNKVVGLEGVSDTSYNAVLFYEKGRVSARVAYNFRSEYLIQASGPGTGLPVYTDSYGSVDARVAFKVLDNLEVSFDGINLNDEDLVQYAELKERVVSYNSFGRRYGIGVRMNF